MAVTINVPINVKIGQIMIRYRAPIAVIEPATEFTTAVVLLFKLIIKVLICWIVDHPIMNHRTPAINDNINAITDIIKEISKTGKDLTVLIIVFASLASSIVFTSFFISNVK